jgi:hypothetical protein
VGITGLPFINQNRDDEILDGEDQESAVDKRAAWYNGFYLV